MAFPTTPLVDDFNRAALGPGYVNPAFGAANGGTITSNQFNFSGSGAAVATAAKIGGPDVEAWLTIATLPTSGNMGIDVQCDSTASTVNGYQLLFNAGTSTVSIRHLIAGAATLIGATISQAIAAGDSVGIRVSGSSTVLIEFWFKPAGGSWTFVDSRTEARPAQIPYAPGFVGLTGPDTVGRYDDFGGGEFSGVAAADRLVFWTELGPSADFGPDPFTPYGSGDFSVSSSLAATLTGLGSAQAFGAPTTVPGGVTTAVTGLGSAQSFGTLKLNIAFSVTGLGSAQAFGSPTMAPGGVVVTPTGLASAKAFGVPQENIAFTIGGLGSAQSFGAPGVTTSGGGQAVSASGLASAGAFGSPSALPGRSGGSGQWASLRAGVRRTTRQPDKAQ
jgi:hypothetical protein